MSVPEKRARPDGFAATHQAYVAWLCDEIRRLGPPVDLVGHDWGAGLTYRIATAHGDLLRSWVAAQVGMPHYLVVTPDGCEHRVEACYPALVLRHRLGGTLRAVDADGV